MNPTGQQAVNTEPAEPHFLLEFPDSRRQTRWLRAGVLSLVVHVFLGTGMVYVASQPVPVYRPPEPVETRRVTPLIAPPAELTQKTPNKAPLSKEFNLESMAPHPEIRNIPTPGAAERPAVHKFTPPTPTRAAVPAPAMPDATVVVTRTDRP